MLGIVLSYRTELPFLLQEVPASGGEGRRHRSLPHKRIKMKSATGHDRNLSGRSEENTDPALAVEGWAEASWSPRLELLAMPGKIFGRAGKKEEERGLREGHFNYRGEHKESIEGR